MTSPNTGLRRSALAVLAVGAAIGASACSAGQVSQTAYQVSAVDGGQGSAGDIHVNDFLVALPESGEGKVGFTATYTGSGFGDPISLDRVEIDGTEVQMGPTKPLERGCALVVSAEDDANLSPTKKDICVEHTTATVPADELNVGVSVPATLTFSNGDQVDTLAGVISEITVAGEFTRPSETVAPPEGH